MNRPLLMKALSLVVLVVVLMIPLSMVHSTVMERMSYQHQARADVARSWGGDQVVVGPLLLQRYEVEVTNEVWDKNLETYVDKTDWALQQRLVFPEHLDIDGDVVVERRYRGIYSIPVYRSDMQMEATVRIPDVPEGARNARNTVLLSVSDMRGFRRQPVMHWQGEPLLVEAGTDSALKGGVHADVSKEAAGHYTITVDLALAGNSTLGIVPVGGDTQLALTSNWAHPGFGGGYLPESHNIHENGFEAAWQVSHYATTARETLRECLGENSCAFGSTELVSLALVEPVNVYLLNERSTKYSLLFVLSVFGIFLVYELLKRLRIHPVQYAMVGLGQAIFFLLLLSLSEHLAFGLAYLAGATACIALLAFYVSHVLGGWRRGMAFGSLLAAIYGALYVILQSEDHALLLGAALLFGLLSVVMFLTRNIDWYSLPPLDAASNQVAS